MAMSTVEGIECLWTLKLSELLNSRIPKHVASLIPLSRNYLETFKLFGFLN